MTSVGLVGCGGWGRNILRDLCGLGATVHVADPDLDAQKRALHGGAASVCADAAEFPECDGMVVAVPIERTGAVVLELLGSVSRAPLFVEKPLALSVEVAQRIADAGADRVFVMDKWRYHPAVAAVRSMIVEGHLGSVESIRFVRWGWWDAPRSLSPTWWLAPHDLSMALDWLGGLPPVRDARTTTHGLTQDLWAYLASDGGPAVTLDIRTGSPEYRRSFTVVCSAGTVHLSDSDAEDLVVTSARPGQPRVEQRVALPRVLPLEEELERFLGYLAGGPPPYSTAADGVTIVRCLAEIENRAAS